MDTAGLETAEKCFPFATEAPQLKEVAAYFECMAPHPLQEYRSCRCEIELMSYIWGAGTANIWNTYDPFRANRFAGKTESSAVNTSSRSADPAAIRQTLNSSATSLRNAFQLLTQNLRRTTMPGLEGNAGTRAQARATTVPPSTYSLLRATREVNERASASQTSAAALGLDVTSPETVSEIRSVSGIGLDVTSPESGTVLESSSSIGLDTTSPEIASRITSTGEANTMPTSYGVIQASFNNGQTSVGTLSGTYTGTGNAANATSLTLTITSFNSTMSGLASLVSFRITDQNGTNLGTRSGLLATGSTLSLGADIGLSIAFSAGSIRNGASTTFAVSNTTPTNVNPDALFNASVNNRPRFDGGATVGAGSFSVNGTSVQVFANDSVNSVLQRINSTVAGVTASFENDRVVLQSSAPSEDDILLANDTSGFLSALKLTSATTVRGNVRDDLQLFAKTTQFASITSGTFEINGTTIAIDRNTDSLDTVLNRINASQAGVTASYDHARGRVVLTTTAASEDPLPVGNDTTGFLAIAKLETANSAFGNVRDDRQRLGKVSAFTSVTNGSFKVNEVEISVNTATDTLETIIARINASGAGVTASYDAAQDKLILHTNDFSEDEITFSDDSSGFLGAIQIDAAVTQRGNIRDDAQKFFKTTQFAEVTAGSFQLNGATIQIDPTTDSLNTVIERINNSHRGVTASFDADANRVVLDPGSGVLVLGNDTTGFFNTVQIAEGAYGTRVNDNAAFSGSGLNSPFFQDGFNVGPGSFQVNGVEIQVTGQDSLQSVLAKINSSSAGVIATFNALSETVSLRARNVGSGAIELDNDTSGFLAAVKLDVTAEFTDGSSGSDKLLREAFPGVGVGSVTINGHSVEIDPDLETLGSLAEKLNDLDGIEAFLDSDTGAFTIRSEAEGGALEIADSSGTLVALGIEDGTYIGREATWRTVHSKNSRFQLMNREKVVDAILASFESLNRALAGIAQTSSLTLTFRDDVQDAVRDAVAAVRDSRSKGLAVVNQADGPFKLQAERSLLANALRQNGRALNEFFEGDSGLPALLEKLAGNAAQNVTVAAPVKIVEVPTPAAAVAAEIADDFYRVASASHLFLIDNVTIDPNGSLTDSGPSPVVEPHEPSSSRHMESSRSLSYSSWRTGGPPADDDGRGASAAYFA